MTDGRRRRYVRWFKLGVGPLIIMCLLGAGPAPEGTEVTGGTGYRMRKYHVSSCDSSYVEHHRDGDVLAAVGVSYRHSGGFTGAIEADGAKKTDVWGDSSGNDYYGHAAARIGYHGTYGGFTLGAVGGSNVILPSLDVWVGGREIYVWGAGLSDAAYHSYSLAKIGLGHSDESFKLDVGISYLPVPGSGGQDADRPLLFIGDLEKNISGPAWLGVSFEVADGYTWTGMLKFSWQFGGDKKKPDGNAADADSRK